MRFTLAKWLATATAFIALGTAAVSAQAPTQTTTSQIVTAANSFLQTLDQTQRQHVMYAFTDNAQRARWSNFPTGVVPRGGVPLKDMTPRQAAAAMKLLATVLSPQGLQKVDEIRQADEDFKTNGSKRGPRGGGPPPPGAGGPPPGGHQGLSGPGGSGGRPPLNSN